MSVTNYHMPSSRISPVDFLAPPVDTPYAGIGLPQVHETAVMQPAIEPVAGQSAWPEFDADAPKTGHELSPDMRLAVNNLAVLSLSTEVADIEKFGQLYSTLTPEEISAFQARRNNLLMERMQAKKPIQPQVEVMKPFGPGVTTTESPETLPTALFPDAKPLYGNPYLESQLSQSLTLLRSPSFRAFYDQLDSHLKLAFDIQAQRDWTHAIGQYGAASLEAAGIVEPTKRWHRVPPYMAQTYQNPTAIHTNYADVVGQYARLQDRQDDQAAA
jgi:hypothetical protein